MIKFFAAVAISLAVIGFNNCSGGFQAQNTQILASRSGLQCVKTSGKLGVQNDTDELILEGRLQITIIDFEDDHTLEFRLVLDSRKTWTLVSTNQSELEKIQPNSRIRVVGKIIDLKQREFSVSEITPVQLALEVVGQEPVFSAAVTGKKKFLAVRVGFSDFPACSEVKIQGIFSKLKTYFLSVSHNQLEFDSDNSDIVEVNIDFPRVKYGTCKTLSYGDWRTAIEEGLKAKGVSLYSYDYAYYIYDLGPGCTLAAGTVGGYAQLGGFKSTIFSCYSNMILNHETGHLLGLGHANQDGREYADGSCVMGNRGVNALNGGHMNRTSWLPAAKTLAVSSSGTVRIAPLHSPLADSSLPQLATIQLPGMATPLYASYRSGESKFDILSVFYEDKLNLHKDLPSAKSHFENAYSKIEDASPADFPADAKLSVKEITANYLEFEITQKADVPCLSAAAHLEVTMLPLKDSEVDKNGEVIRSYEISFQNLDSQSCGTSNFSFEVETNPLLPGVFDKSAFPSTLPGTTEKLLMKISTDPRLGSGIYPILVRLNKNGGTSVEKYLNLILTRPGADPDDIVCPDGYTKK